MLAQLLPLLLPLLAATATATEEETKPVLRLFCFFFFVYAVIFVALLRDHTPTQWQANTHTHTHSCIVVRRPHLQCSLCVRERGGWGHVGGCHHTPRRSKNFVVFVVQRSFFSHTHTHTFSSTHTVAGARARTQNGLNKKIFFFLLCSFLACTHVHPCLPSRLHSRVLVSCS